MLYRQLIDCGVQGRIKTWGDSRNQKHILTDYIFGIFHEILDKKYSQDTRLLDNEGTNATLCAPRPIFHPEIDLDLTVSLFTPSDKWQTFPVQSGLTWPMANKQPHAVQTLDEFQVIDTVGRLSSLCA